MVSKMPNVTLPTGTFNDSVKGWQQQWFYITEPRDTNGPLLLNSDLVPPAAYVLAQEGLGLVFVRRAVGAPDARQGYGRQEYQTCQCSPGDVSSPDPSLSTPGLQFMGIRPDEAPEPARALWLLTQRHLEGAF